jgi:Xaa-Pro aminopeptidase
VNAAVALDLQAELEKSRGLAPKPPAAEQEGRLERARDAMRSRDLDGLVVWGSAGANPEPIRYLAGYVHVFPGASSLLVLSHDRPPVLLIDQPWHVEEAVRMSWIDDVRSYPNPARRWLADELQRTLAGAFRDAGLERGQVGVFSGAMPAVYRDVLAATLPDVAFAEGAGVWEELVATPSAYDAETIRKNAAIADEGLAAAVAAAGEGVTELDVCMASLTAMAAVGGEFLHGSGVSTHVNIGSFSDSISNVRPHLFTARPLERGQMFWFDLTASHAGCYTDCDRTISVGEPSAAQREIYDVTAEMYAALLEGVKPGVTGGELWDAALEIAARAGYSDYVNHVYFGHTTGITTSARPVIAAGETGELRPGSFINVEPGIFVPGVGSACIENTLLVDEGGSLPINSFGTEIHVV